MGSRGPPDLRSGPTLTKLAAPGSSRHANRSSTGARARARGRGYFDESATRRRNEKPGRRGARGVGKEEERLALQAPGRGEWGEGRGGKRRKGGWGAVSSSNVQSGCAETPSLMRSRTSASTRARRAWRPSRSPSSATPRRLPGGRPACRTPHERTVSASVPQTKREDRKRGTHRVGRREEGLDREEDGADLEGRGPLVLEDVEADAAQLVDVGVVDLGQEAHFRGRHWVVVWEEELELELAACARGEGGRGRASE